MKYLIKGLKIVFTPILLLLIGALLSFAHRDIPLHELKAKYTNAASSFISVDGMEVHFRDEGDQSVPDTKCWSAFSKS